MEENKEKELAVTGEAEATPDLAVLAERQRKLEHTAGDPRMERPVIAKKGQVIGDPEQHVKPEDARMELPEVKPPKTLKESEKESFAVRAEELRQTVLIKAKVIKDLLQAGESLASPKLGGPAVEFRHAWNTAVMAKAIPGKTIVESGGLCMNTLQALQEL